MYKSMKKLVEKKYYKTADEAQQKLDVFYACNRLTADEYTDLTMLVLTQYGFEQ